MRITISWVVRQLYKGKTYENIMLGILGCRLRAGKTLPALPWLFH